MNGCDGDLVFGWIVMEVKSRNRATANNSCSGKGYDIKGGSDIGDGGNGCKGKDKMARRMGVDMEIEN